ncbi:MAG: hypothetical protein IPL84_15010 [Chitinophagaceae bacterium]|nr:hypothetical protein [Chitinophagaceae bacterium]
MIQKTLQDNTNLLYIGIIIIAFQLLNSLLSTILISYKYFTATIFTGLINSLFAITFTLVFHSKFGIVGTMLGVSLGYLVNFVLLIYILRRYQKWNFFQVKWMAKKEVWGNIGLMQANVLPIWIRNTIALYLLSGLGKGIITAVNLGQQVSMIPDILIIGQLISIASIKFNDLNAAKKQAELNEIFLKVCVWGISITMFISFVFILFSTELIGILYGRKSITAESLNNIEIVFAFSIACLSVKFIASVCTNLITAAQKVRATFVMSIVTHSIVTIAIYFLINYFGLIGYLIGINLHFYLFFFFFYILLKKTMPFIEYEKVFKIFFANLLNNALVFGLIFMLYYFQLKHLGNPYLIVAIGVLLYSLLTIGINELNSANKYLKVKNIYQHGFKRSFKELLKKEINKNKNNNYNDNWDYILYGDDRSKPGLRGKLNNLASKAIPENIHAEFVINYFLKKHIDGLVLLFNNLFDSSSRDLLIRVLTFRILGHRKYKLPLSNQKYWDNLKLAETLIIDNEDFIDPKFLGILLKKHDLRPIGFPITFYFTPMGVLIDFIIKQYEFKVDGKVIKAEKNDVVLDCGGCWGDTALFFSNEVGAAGKVYSFEFIPSNIEIYRKNLQLNPHLADSIEIISSPVWSTSGQKLYYKDFGPASKVSNVQIENGTGETLTIAIDDFVEEKNWTKLISLKWILRGLN